MTLTLGVARTRRRAEGLAQECAVASASYCNKNLARKKVTHSSQNIGGITTSQKGQMGAMYDFLFLVTYLTCFECQFGTGINE